SVLAGREVDLGEFADALLQYRRNLALREQIAKANPANRVTTRDLMIAWSHLGDLLSKPESGSVFNLADATADYTRTVAIARKLSAADETDKNARYDVSRALVGMADLLAADHRPREAVVSYNQVLEILDGLSAADPSNGRFREDIEYAA